MLESRSYHPYTSTGATVNRADAQDGRCNGEGTDDTPDANGGISAGGYAGGASIRTNDDDDGDDDDDDISKEVYVTDL